MGIILNFSAAIKPPFSSPLSLPSRTSKLQIALKNTKAQPHTKHENAWFFPNSTFLFFLISSPIQAKAFTLPKEEIVSSLIHVEKAIDQIEEMGSSFMESGQQVYDSVKPSIDAAVETTVPIVQHAGEAAMNAASPVVSDAIKVAQDAMQRSGFDTQQVVNVAKTVTSVAGKTLENVEPIAVSAVETISNSERVVIAEYGAALLLAYLLVPPIFSSILFKLRGYRGRLTPIQALHRISTQNYFLIDIRSEMNKSNTGIPQLHSNVKNQMISIPQEELPIKLRNLLNNPKKMETEMVALKISHLKRLTKSSNIVIMDLNSVSDTGKVVAKTLTCLGFKHCWIMDGGFSGNNGWLQNYLGSESYDPSHQDPVSLPRLACSGSQLVGTASSVVQRSKHLLPSTDAAN